MFGRAATLPAVGNFEAAAMSIVPATNSLRPVPLPGGGLTMFTVCPARAHPLAGSATQLEKLEFASSLTGNTVDDPSIFRVLGVRSAFVLLISSEAVAAIITIAKIVVIVLALWFDLFIFSFSPICFFPSLFTERDLLPFCYGFQSCQIFPFPK